MTTIPNKELAGDPLPLPVFELDCRDAIDTAYIIAGQLNNHDPISQERNEDKALDAGREAINVRKPRLCRIDVVKKAGGFVVVCGNFGECGGSTPVRGYYPQG